MGQADGSEKEYVWDDSLPGTVNAFMWMMKHGDDIQAPDTLVVAVEGPINWAGIVQKGKYHLPKGRISADRKLEWLAFYFTKAFGRTFNGIYAVARIKRIETDNDRLAICFYADNLGHINQAIENTSGHRLTYLLTYYKLLPVALDLEQLMAMSRGYTNYADFQVDSYPTARHISWQSGRPPLSEEQRQFAANLKNRLV